MQKVVGTVPIIHSENRTTTKEKLAIIGHSRPVPYARLKPWISLDEEWTAIDPDWLSSYPQRHILD